MMTARSRGYNQDWDPMREDFDNSSYDPQNADDNSSGYANLDHCRLYITNIPNGLSEDGLSTAFAKYGRLTEVFVSKNPDKRYGLVAFETPGEAKFAMTKLNRTEPLKLNINIAYKSNARPKRQVDKKDNSGYRSSNSNGPRNRDDRSVRDETGSSGSRSNPRRQDSMANGDNMEELIDDDVVLSGTLEPDVNLELEKLKMEHLKLQEAQVLCKHRMLLLKQAEKKSSAGSRCILPDGRIVVRNADKGESHDADGSFGAGAGDAPKIPGLQSCGVCVACGQRAEAFCSGCRVTPYCSAACQRRDWLERHKNTCHNLKRQSVGVASRLEIEPEAPAPAAALRRPRSPEGARDAGDDRLPPRKFVPPGNTAALTPVAKSYNSRGGNAGGYNRANQGSDSDRGQSDSRGQSDNRGYSDNRGQSENRVYSDNRGQSDNRGRMNRSADDNRPNARTNDRSSSARKNEDRPSSGPRNQDGNRRYGQPARRPKEDEDLGPKPSGQPAEPKPAKASPSVAKEPVSSPTVAPTPSASTSRPIAAVADVAPVPARKATAQKPATPALVPKNCVIDTLSVKDTFMLTAESTAGSCGGGSGFICLSLPADHMDNYERLLDPLAQACDSSEACQLRPGDTFAYLDPSDGGWYRARCLSATRAALLDAARVVALAHTDQCRKLPADFAAIPEFCCQLESDVVQLKDQVHCTVVSKSGGELTVSLTSLESGAALGAGVLRRWLSDVQRPQEPAASSRPEPSKTAPASTSSGPAKSAPINAGEPPEVPRPPVASGSAVLLVAADEPARVLVRGAARAAQASFNDLLCDVALYGAGEDTPTLKELPTAGQTVVARYTDGTHYRALVRRVSSKHKRCLLEYIEHGNVGIVELENLSPCPPQFDLSSLPTPTSLAALDMKQTAFSAAATAYLDTLKDNEVELTLTIPSGEKSGPSKTPVRLTVVKSGEDVNRTVDALSTPEWQKILERGGDVLDVEAMFFHQISYVDPPSSGGELDILDCSLLQHGMLAGHARAAEHARRAFALATQLNEYCNSALARDPYTPKSEELCIAMCPKRKQWLRAALLHQIGGPGGADANILFYDYGELAVLPITSLRKMMPEFARDIPAASCTLLIKDFPENPTPDQLERARRHLRLSEHGVGTLRAARVTRQDVGEYLVDAPELMQAIA